MKRFFSLCVVLFLILNLKAQTVDKKYVDGLIYFQLASSYPWEQLHVNAHDVVDQDDFPFLTEVFRKYGVNAVLRPFHLFGNEQLLRVMEVHFDRMELVDAFVEELETFEQISYAEKVPLMRPQYKPNDPYYGTVSGRNWKWHLDMIKADSAWELQQGKPYVKVAIVDGFVWGDHPDLQMDSANLCTVSYSYYGSGYSYSVGSATPPSSIAQGSTVTAYSASHGTHCAGLVGAINNNNIGIASIGGGVTLMGVASTNAQYSEYVLFGMQGVQWAAENGADVISMSFGGTGSQTQKNLMQTCYDAGVVLLASAGNEGDEDNDIIYPAGYPTVISVASVDGDGRLSYFSQWGVGRADIAAPGGFIAYNSSTSTPTYPNMLSTTYNKAYVLSYMGFSGTFYDGMQGTSMACPLAAGVVGLMLSRDSTLSPDMVKTRLQMTATPLNSASEHTIDGYGYVNAYAALLYKYVIVSKNSLLFAKEAGQVDSIFVSASEAWTLSGVPSWLSVNKTSGDSGLTKLVFTILSENTTSDRTANLTISTKDAGTASVKITQATYSFVMEITPKTILFGSARQLRDTIRVHATVNWSLDNSSSWLASDIQTITADSSIVVLATRSTNSWGRNRDINLVFSAEGMPNDTVYVMQKMADFITLSASVKNIGARRGDTVSINVFSNVRWTVTPSETYSWIEPDVTTGEDTLRLTFTVLEENNTEATRSASFVISNGSINKSVTIKQAAVGIRESERLTGVVVTPNPAKDKVSVSFASKVDALQVTDVQGRIIAIEKVDGNEAQLDVSGYANGVYLIRGIEGSRLVGMGKMVKFE